MPRTIFITLVALLVGGCGDVGRQAPTGNEIWITDGTEDAPIRTAGEHFVFVPGPVFSTVQIPFVYENRTERTPYYLVHCNGAFDFRLEKRIDDAWVEAHGPLLPGCLSVPPIRIGPGERWSASVSVYVSIQEGVPPELIALDPEGTYRIVLSTLSAFDPDRYPFGPSVPKADRVSNAFQLVVEEPGPGR